MIRQLTKSVGMPRSAAGPCSLLVVTLLCSGGCQLAPARKLYKPRAADQLIDSMPSSSSTAPVKMLNRPPQETYEGSARTPSASPATQTSSQQAPSSVDHALATTVQYAQQGSQFQLSPFAIVRGQSGWVPSNPGTAPQGGGAPGYLTDTTPSVSRYQPPPTYGSAVAPGTYAGQGSIAPGATGYIDGSGDVPTITAPGGYQPRVEVAPLDVYVQEKRTGRIILGGSVNSDLGVAGQIIIDERNFDIRAIPRSWGDLFSGYAFRGAGQSFRVELMPGNQVERYTANWTTPNLFGYMPYSLSVGGFYFTRQYQDWTERRLGARVGLGYNITKDLSIGTELRGENVKISNPRISGVQKLDSVLGRNELFSARFSIAHDTRDSAFLATQGALLQLIYDQAFGNFDYPQGQVNYSRYFRVHERADGLGRHVLASTWKVGFSGTQTPIFENFYAGGFSSMRGFRFRGASPVEDGVQVGGRFMFLGSLEYMFPLTADEMLRGVAFVDYGTVEQNITIKEENFRVAPGLGLRISVPMLGPAPLAFDFSVPVAKADGDRTQLLSFYMGFTR
jgi:outer membrane protein insertion porin family